MHPEQRNPKKYIQIHAQYLLIPANPYQLGPPKYVLIHMNTYTVHANTYQYIQFFVLSRKRVHWKTSTYEYLSIHTQWLSATQHSYIPNSGGTTYPKRLQHNNLKSQTLKNVCNTAHTKLEYIPIQ